MSDTYNSVDFANFKLIKRRSITNANILKMYEFIHYGTLIMTVTYFNNDSVLISSEFGYSITDRDNMNGLLKLLGIKTIICYRHYGRIYFTDGKSRDNTTVQLSTYDYHRID